MGRNSIFYPFEESVNALLSCNMITDYVSLYNMIGRRQLLKTCAPAVVMPSFPAILSGKNPNTRLRVGVMGLSRGKAHIAGFTGIDNAEIAYVCDVDKNRLASGIKYAAARQGGKEPKGVTDFREILEDKEVDILSIAAPNFWHAPAAILACDAKKQVYVEKPGSHNAHEAKLIVEAARKNKCLVQMGNQRRSLPSYREGISKIKDGVLGNLRYARCWYDNHRPSIGRGKKVPAPDWLDWNLWQGPAPDRPYKDNLVHYNWHWHWHYGGGELANNGVHALDIARWGLGVDFPIRVTCNGGRYHHDDDQETPDTADATYDFGKVGISWHGSSCLQRKHEKNSFVSIYGDKGVMAFESSGYRIYDMDGKVTEENIPPFTNLPHFKNFAAAIREGSGLNAEISDAQKSSMMCHLGNIAYRMRTEIRFDSKTQRITDNPAAEKLWGREYREGWKPKV